jgi:hypothetical protein
MPCFCHLLSALTTSCQLQCSLFGRVARSGCSKLGLARYALFATSGIKRNRIIIV